MKILHALIFSCLMIGCGSGNGSGSNNNGGGGTPSFTPVNVQGQYEVQANSTVVQNGVTLIETNFTQTDTSVFAAKGSVVVIGGTLSNNLISLETVAGECDNGVLGNDSLQGTFSSATQATFTLTEAGSLGTGTAAGSPTFSSDGTKIVSGTYSVPAQCGFPADSGSLVGIQVPGFSGTYSGMLANSGGGTDIVIVTISQTGLNLSVSGTDDGTPFTLNGTAVGATFNVSGTIAGQQTQAIGLFDVVNNDFLVYDIAGDYLGQLNSGSNPQAALRPSRFKAGERIFIQRY
jgi:hypothetical protein